MAAQTPAMPGAPVSGTFAQTPVTPTTTTEASPQDAENDPQYAERDASTDNTWIIIAVVLMIVITVLGVGLAAMGLSAE